MSLRFVKYEIAEGKPKGGVRRLDFYTYLCISVMAHWQLEKEEDCAHHREGIDKENETLSFWEVCRYLVGFWA